jgi:Uma2 family endonuclease
VPQPARWTVAEYRRLGAAGAFGDRRTTLLNGEIFDMPIPSPPHDVALGQAEDLLRATFAVGHHVRCQMGFDVGADSDPGPDLAVVTGIRKDYTAAMPTTAVLIVEVACSSLTTDMTTKAELYATAGVPDYWVVDVDNRKSHVFRDPAPLPAGLGATAYRTRLTLAEADSVAPLSAPAASVRVADLLP